MDLTEIINQIESCNFECEAGSLINNIAWRELVELSSPELQLAETLTVITENDKNYSLRNVLIIEAMHYAQMCGYASGYRIDVQEPDWPVAFIALPTGQVSWHMPQFPVSWDGHDTAEKHDRIKRFASTFTT